jgi:hypothetical protein
VYTVCENVGKCHLTFCLIIVFDKAAQNRILEAKFIFSSVICTDEFCMFRPLDRTQ